MTDPTRRQIAMMAEEVGITDHDAAVKLVRRAFEVFRPASAALAADGPAVPEGREPASVVGEPSNRMPTLNGIMQLADNYFTFRGNSHGDSFFATSIEANKDPAQSIYEFARAVLARWGHQPAPPAAGEVEELVARLRRASDGASAMGWEQDSWVIARAADLLAQRPEPVPVAIPGEEYHEDMGAVTWWRIPVEEPPWVGTPNDSDWPGYHTHFTPAPPEPAHALPLPAGEVE